MCFKQSMTLLAFATLSLSIVASEEKFNLNLLSIMARSNDMMQRNPSRSSECFNYYIPLIDEIAKAYQQNHDSCLQASRDGRSEAEAATLEQRNALADSASSSCALLSQCSEIESAENVFECYAEGGAENVKKMYSINVDASEHLSDLQEEFRLIENREYKCTNETKRQYEKDSSKAYEDFNKCILGIIDVPKPTNPTVAPETTTEPATPESTANPEGPTETTQSPESTEIPESSESPEGGESSEINAETRLPEEDLS